jgi:hypothetical protein
VVKCPATRHDLAQALAKAYELAPIEADPRYPNPYEGNRSGRPPDIVLAAMGFTSRTQFERGAKSFSIVGASDLVRVDAMVPDLRRASGYSGIAWEQDLDANASAVEIASLIVEREPETPGRPMAPPAKTKSSSGTVHASDVPKLVGEYVGDLMSYDSALTELGRDDNPPNELLEWLAIFTDEELGRDMTTDGEPLDQLRRILALVEILLRDGDDAVREATLDQFVRTRIVSQPHIRKLAGPVTRRAVKEHASSQ